jgi:hypothetical protein
VLERILGPKKEEVSGNWIKILYEELYDLYSSTKVFQLIEQRGIG